MDYKLPLDKINKVWYNNKLMAIKPNKKGDAQNIERFYRYNW